MLSQSGRACAPGRCGSATRAGGSSGSWEHEICCGNGLVASLLLLHTSEKPRGTADPPGRRAWSLQAQKCARSAGMKRGFLTGLPRRPWNTLSRPPTMGRAGAEPSQKPGRRFCRESKPRGSTPESDFRFYEFFGNTGAGCHQRGSAVVQPAAAGIDQSRDLIGAGVDDPVVATIGTTSGLGLRLPCCLHPSGWSDSMMYMLAGDQTLQSVQQVLRLSAKNCRRCSGSV